MNNLPAEIASAIANNAHSKDLPALTLVNRQFNTATNPLLWRSVSFRYVQQLNILLHGAILSHFGLLQHVRTLILDFAINDVAVLLLLPKLSPLLETLSIAGEFITDASFNHLPQHCPHLTSLTLRFASITDQAMVSVGQHCHQLQRISLLDCRKLSGHLFAPLSGCPLKEICIEALLLSSDDLENETRIMAHDMVRRFPLLTSLECSHLDDTFPIHLFEAPLLDPQTGHSAWPHLTRFHLLGCDEFQDDNAMAFIRAHPHLTDLQLAASNLTDPVLECIADTLSSLTTLDLSYGHLLTHQGVRRIIQQCPLLTSLNVTESGVYIADFPLLELDHMDGDDGEMELEILDRFDIGLIRRSINLNNNNNNNDTTVSNG